MQLQNHILRKGIIALILLVIVLPCLFLLYDTVTAAGKERAELYYMMADGEMKAVERTVARGTAEEMLLSVLTALQESPKVDGASASVPQEVSFLSAELQGDTAVVDLSDGYRRLQSVEEAVCRSSIVWSLTSLEFVENVSLEVEGVPLRNKEGEEYGLLNRSNVLIHSEISAETTEYAILKLYFANAEGTGLEVEERVVEVKANQAREKTIVEQLIAGPQEEGLGRTVPAETKIRDVTTTSDGTCYVDLSQDFVTKHSGGETAELLTIYSIVNSLCELDNVDKVQFLIGGEKWDRFKGNVEFGTPFTAVTSLKTAGM